MNKPTYTSIRNDVTKQYITLKMYPNFIQAIRFNKDGSEKVLKVVLVPGDISSHDYIKTEQGMRKCVEGVFG